MFGAGGWGHMPYAYYAREEDWSQINPAAVWWDPNDELTEDELRSGRVLMTDVLYRQGGSNDWNYNHGRYGPSLNTYHAVVQGRINHDNQDRPSFTGINRLFGDGAVVWKPREAFTELNFGLFIADPAVAQTVGVFNGDRNYW